MSFNAGCRLLLAVLLSIASATITRPAMAAGTTPARSCESLAELALPNTVFNSVAVVPATADLPAYCAVKATVSNPPAYTDAVRVGVFLPLDNWNGRFQAIGGGGFLGGDPDKPDAAALQGGYATAGTDTGHAGASGAFALNPDGTPNWQAIVDFGYLGIHDMTVLSKTVIQTFYGTPPAYSYFNGCSTGGRQGLIEAQRYPEDYDGIAAGSPAINSQKLRVIQAWGQLQMLQSGDVIPQCKFDAFTSAAISACDPQDGISDGIISDWQNCTFDPHSLVGSVTPCGTITATDADIVGSMWVGAVDPQGDRIWYGFEPGSDFQGVNGTTIGPNGTLVGQPFAILPDWYRYFLTRNRNWDWRTLTYAQFLQFFRQASSEFADLDVTAEDRPDLSRFSRAGGKLVMWHGTVDQLVPPRGTLDYYERVVNTVGGQAAADAFVRLFFAPGVAHCGGGPGAAPSNAFESMVDWVENGHAPASLDGEKEDPSGATLLSRPICAYPRVARYDGVGDPSEAASFTCASTFASTFK